MAFYSEYVRRKRKDGTLGRVECVLYQYTPLLTCEICGKTSTPKKVTTRNDIYGWNRIKKKDYSEKSKDILCVSCWNKVRAVLKKEDECKKIQSLINKMKGEICQKSKLPETLGNSLQQCL